MLVGISGLSPVQAIDDEELENAIEYNVLMTYVGCSFY